MVNYTMSGLAFGATYCIIHLTIWRDWPDPMTGVLPLLLCGAVGAVIGWTQARKKRQQPFPD